MLSRRRFLTGLAAAGVLGATGCTIPDGITSRERARCVPRDSLPGTHQLAGVPLIYEVDGRTRTFHIDPAFQQQLEAWAADWQETTGLRFDRIDTYGTWTDGRGQCDSWHHSGRALDIARLRLDGQAVVSCREDLWANDPAAASLRRGYWALAAHLHIHFAYVLTYLYDDLHRNHIHLDNGVSGAGLSSFRSGSRVQVQAVQATARWLFDEPVELTGRWDAATRRTSRAILQASGHTGDLTDRANWHAYLRAAVRQLPSS